MHTAPTHCAARIAWQTLRPRRDGAWLGVCDPACCRCCRTCTHMHPPPSFPLYLGSLTSLMRAQCWVTHAARSSLHLSRRACPAASPPFRRWAQLGGGRGLRACVDVARVHPASCLSGACSRAVVCVSYVRLHEAHVAQLLCGLSQLQLLLDGWVFPCQSPGCNWAAASSRTPTPAPPAHCQVEDRPLVVERVVTEVVHRPVEKEYITEVSMRMPARNGRNALHARLDPAWPTRMQVVCTCAANACASTAHAATPRAPAARSSSTPPPLPPHPPSPHTHTHHCLAPLCRHA
jgi:hypothetical protein